MSVDPVTAVTAASAAVGALGGAKGVGWAGQKLLGPLFDEIAESWRERYSEKRKRNLARILRNAEGKAGDALHGDAEVSGRIVNRVIEDGSWAEGPLMAEYFGGILAASLSDGGEDDRGLVWADLVARVAATDVLLHYVIYDAFRRIYAGRSLDLGSSSVLAACRLYLPMTKISTDHPKDLRHLEAVVIFDENCPAPTEYIYTGAVFDYGTAAVSLRRQGLIDEYMVAASEERLSDTLDIDAPRSGLIVAPSIPGIELFLWAHGVTRPFRAILDRRDEFKVAEEIEPITDARELAIMQQERRDRAAVEFDQSLRSDG